MLRFYRLPQGAICLLLPLMWSCSSQHDDTISLDPEDYPFAFHLQDSLEGAWHFADLDGDGVDELIHTRAGPVRNTSLVLIKKHSGVTLEQTNLPPTQAVNFHFAYDTNGDGMKELFVNTRERDTLFAYIIDISPPRVLKKFALFLSKGSQATLPRDYGTDLHGIVHRTKGFSDVVLCVFTGSSPGCERGVAAFNVETGKQEWAFPIGAWPGSPVVADIDEDGIAEIFLTATAPGNGFSANGFDDHHSYLIALSADGKKLWSKVLGGTASGASVALHDIDRDGQEELITLFTSSNKVVEKSYAAVIDPRTGNERVKRKYFDEQIYTTTGPFIFNRPRQDFLVVLALSGHTSAEGLRSAGGKVFLLDHNLQTISVKRFPISIRDGKLLDVDGDTRMEIAVGCSNGQTAVLNDDLQPVALMRGHVDAKRLTPGEKSHVILIHSPGSAIGTLESVTPAYQRWARWIGLGLLIVAIVTAGAYASFRLLFYLRLFLTISRDTHQIAAMVLSRTGKILHGNDALLRMFDIPNDSYRKKPWRRVFASSQHQSVARLLQDALPLRRPREEKIPYFHGHAEVNLLVKIQPILVGGFYLGSLVIFDDISQAIKTERALNWGLVAQNLAHEMKTPLSTIWFTLERIRQKSAERPDGDHEPLIVSIEEEIRRLDGYVKGFMKLAHLNPPNLQPCDAHEVLEDILEHYLPKIPDSVRIEKNFAADLPTVNLDVHLFTAAIINLLDNAVAAMQGKGSLRVSTYLAQNLSISHVCVAIADTGCGIAADDAGKIFTPYFTKSAQGTGLGLTITKKIVEDHGGTIGFTTREGRGTEFVIRLPVSISGTGVHLA
jgi:nitrogen-specific signal transduction histidine kinase